MNTFSGKALLLQFRASAQMQDQEHQIFAHQAGVSPVQIDCYNAFVRPKVPKDLARGYRAVFVGGSTAGNMLTPEKFPGIEASFAVLDDCLTRDIPVFASCFGFQIAVKFLGGEIMQCQGAHELGTLPIELTGHAKNDPLFQNLPNPFYAATGHMQLAKKAPAGTLALAKTDQCLQAFRVEGHRFWAFQFHPELDRKAFVQRLLAFRNRYTQGTEHLDRVIETAVEVPHSTGLVGRFARYVGL